MTFSSPNTKLPHDIQYPQIYPDFMYSFVHISSFDICNRASATYVIFILGTEVVERVQLIAEVAFDVELKGQRAYFIG